VRLDEVLCVIRGGGDLATGVGYRLRRAGFSIIVTELARPLALRRAVCFAEAIYAGVVEVEGVRVQRTATVPAALRLAAVGWVPVIVDQDGQVLASAHPFVVVDGRMAKVNLGTRITDAPLVIGLGPGFTAGVDCHAVVETCRGHHLGQVIWKGTAIPDTGQPEAVNGHVGDRVLRAPRAGVLQVQRAIGDVVASGEALAEVDGAPVRAPFAGVLRGIAHDELPVTPGMKIGDVDPRGVRDDCFEISDKALAVGGGVLEAVLGWFNTREVGG
jgi:xanthine dehydrogenase accessory factor